MTANDASGPVVNLSQEASTGLPEIALIVVVVALAAACLWRTYFRRRGKGKGGGCAGCGGAAACPITHHDEPARPGGQGRVYPSDSDPVAR